MIRKHAEWIVQLHSPNDEGIPVAEGRFVADKLQLEYMKMEGRGHFVDDELPEVVRVIKEKTVSVESLTGKYHPVISYLFKMKRHLEV